MTKAEEKVKGAIDSTAGAAKEVVEKATDLVEKGHDKAKELVQKGNDKARRVAREFGHTVEHAGQRITDGVADKPRE